MFHGANVPAELLGCIGISYSRPTKGTLFGDLSSELWDEFEKGGKNGVLIVTNAGEEIDTGKRFFLVVAIAGALLLLTRNKHKGGYKEKKKRKLGSNFRTGGKPGFRVR